MEKSVRKIVIEENSYLFHLAQALVALNNASGRLDDARARDHHVETAILHVGSSLAVQILNDIELS